MTMTPSQKSLPAAAFPHPCGVPSRIPLDAKDMVLLDEAREPGSVHWLPPVVHDDVEDDDDDDDDDGGGGDNGDNNDGDNGIDGIPMQDVALF